MRQIECLQAGRAIAALAVVVHHANIASKDFAGSHLPVLDYGWLGVDFFFVLSGFIIAHSAPGKTFLEYSWHRFRRVVVPYLPIGAFMALVYTFLPSISAGERDWNWLASLTLLPLGSPALSVAWTLQHEVLFYVLFAIAFFSNRIWLLALWGAVCVLGPSDWIPFRIINLEFLMGVVCYHLSIKVRPTYWLALLSSVPLAIWIFLGATRETSWLVGLAIAITLPALIRLEKEGMKIPDFLIFLGGASYSLYLAHGLAISVVARVAPSLGVLIFAGVVGGLAYYVCVEKIALKIVPKAINSSLPRSSTSESLNAENVPRPS